MNKILKEEIINKIHTTKLGIERIRKNLHIDIEDVVTYIKNQIIDNDCIIIKKGKNYYCEVKDMRVTINSYNYGIITAHLI